MSAPRLDHRAACFEHWCRLSPRRHETAIARLSIDVRDHVMPRSLPVVDGDEDDPRAHRAADMPTCAP